MDFHPQACGDWIRFTVVTNLALSASGVGIESYPDSPEGLIVLHPILYTTFFNLNILLMALHEHPTLFSLSLLLLGLYYHLSPYTIAICMCSCFLHGIMVRQQFHLNRGYSSPHCSTTGGVRAVHVSTAKFIHG